jgi:hypothetical protein
MRFWTLIFSIYILGLALMPCSDEVACEHENSAVASNLDLDHDHSEDETDTCSPFCSCSCCGITAHVVQFQYFSFNLPKAVLVDWVVAPKSEFISCYYYTFWQPPKV